MTDICGDPRLAMAHKGLLAFPELTRRLGKSRIAVEPGGQAHMGNCSRCPFSLPQGPRLFPQAAPLAVGWGPPSWKTGVLEALAIRLVAGGLGSLSGDDSKVRGAELGSLSPVFCQPFCPKGRG